MVYFKDKSINMWVFGKAGKIKLLYFPFPTGLLYFPNLTN
jgi:hypothetical protein